MWRLVLAERDRNVSQRVSAAFARDERFRIVAVAQTSETATRIVQVLRPDMVLANVELSRFVPTVMAQAPTHIVAYATTSTTAEVQLKQAVESGAHDALTLTHEQQLVALAEKWCKEPKPKARAAPMSAPPLRRGLPPRVVAIGASLGGPAALELLVRAWPRTFPLPIVVAQHLTAGFSNDLVHWLNTLRSLRVKIAEAGESLQPGTMYFAPDGMHVTVTSSEELRVTPAGPDESHVPSVNTLFQSVAQSYGGAAVGVLLTGMGEDGARGMRELVDRGARTVVQNQQTSTAFGMPQAAIKHGGAGVVLPLSDIAHYVLDCTQRGRH